MSSIWKVAAGTLRPVQSLDRLTGLLLQHRGLREDGADSFFEPRYDRDIHDPHALWGMDVAVERIFDAVDAGESIVVYGDYDADGISATAIVVDVLHSLGAKVVPYIPHRFDDGYGLHLPALKKLAADLDLLITVDCGVSNVQEVQWLNKHNKDVIIVDHHEAGSDMPPALALLHPRHRDGHYPFPHLCAAGVAFKLAQALLRDTRSPYRNDPDREKWLLDLASIGTVADMVPLVGENRAIVRFGFEIIRRSRRPGVRALLHNGLRSGSAITADRISYRVIPKLNAAGRIDHAQPALDLLLCTSNSRATDIIRQLEKYNRERQSITARVLREAGEQIGGDAPMIFVSDFSWPAGVVGLAAGRLADQFARPAVVVGGNGRHGVGSARSPEGLNVLDIISAGKDHLLKVGGHRRAAGFSVEAGKLKLLRRALFGYMKKNGNASAAPASRRADAVIHPKVVGWELSHILEKFEPYGQGNLKPTFIARKLRLGGIRLVGKNKEHAKFVFLSEDRELEAIGFRMAQQAQAITKDADVLFEVDVNEFRGREDLQLCVRDIVPGGSATIQKVSA